MPRDVADVERRVLEEKIKCYLVDHRGKAYTVDEVIDHLKTFEAEPWCEFMKTDRSKEIVAEKLREMAARIEIQRKDVIDDKTGHEERYYYARNDS